PASSARRHAPANRTRSSSNPSSPSIASTGIRRRRSPTTVDMPGSVSNRARSRAGTSARCPYRKAHVMSDSLWEEGEDILALRKLIRDWGTKEIRPNFRTLEDAGEFPREIYRQMGELGLFAAAFPEEFGGLGGGYRAL